MSKKFSDDFLWGCATASYQVEGATKVGGRVDCIWDTYAKVPGAIIAGQNGDVAADQYNRYKEDVAIMASLGFQSYRFSIAWPRIIKEDRSVNLEGINYYINLCEELRKYNILPVVTLYHWDLPQYLEDKGGWTNRATAYEFLEYSKVCFKYLAKYVHKWITLNEPYCSAYLGYLVGRHAPGIKDFDKANRAVHHLNLAHGLVVNYYNSLNLDAEIGIVLNPNMPRPASRKAEDLKASRNQQAFDTDVFILPLLGKGYPEEVINELGVKYPIEEGDLDIISSPFNFIGINYYFENVVKYQEGEFNNYTEALSAGPVTQMGWPIVPSGLMRVLEYFNKISDGMPLYITENGIACDDKVDIDGRVRDYERMDYLRKHFEVCLEAIEKGIPLKGYFVWSFIDNFEWAFGYERRFGIVHCNYSNMERTIKDSAYMIRDYISGFMI